MFIRPTEKKYTKIKYNPYSLLLNVARTIYKQWRVGGRAQISKTSDGGKNFNCETAPYRARPTAYTSGIGSSVVCSRIRPIMDSNTWK